MILKPFVQLGQLLKVKFFVHLSWLVLLCIVMPRSSVVSAFPVQDNLVASSTVILRDEFGTRSAGVYLGNGIILTSWQNVVGERYLWDIEYQQAPKLAIQIEEYPNQSLIDPFLGYVCQDGQGFSYQTEPTTKQCASYNLTNGMTAQREGYEDSTPIEKLLYANREFDIALLSINENASFARNLRPAFISAYPLYKNQILVIPTEIQGLVQDNKPTLQDQPAHGIFDGSQQRSVVIAFSTNEPVRLPIGTPIYDTDGYIVGLYWGQEQNKLYLTPASVWYHQLWQADEILQEISINTVLIQANIPDRIRAEPSIIKDDFSPEIGNMGYDVLHYDLDLTIIPTDRFIQGIATLTIQAKYHHLSQFSLDFSVMQATSVKVDGVEASFKQANEKLKISLNEPMEYGQRFVLEIIYWGIAQATDTPYSDNFRVGLEYEGEPPRLAFANQPDGAHTWYPCNDHPLDRATYDFHIRVPEEYTAVANGVLINMNNEGNYTTYHWQMRYPMGTNLSIVAVAFYDRIDDITSSGIPLQHYAYDGTAEAVAYILSTTDIAFQILESYFGPYPFDTYGHVVTPLKGGAIETQTMTMLPTDTAYSSPEYFFDLVVHELAHHWYGNSVTLASWRDIWLNEGFATYAEWLAVETQGGTEAFQNLLSLQENAISASRRTTPLAYPLQSEIFGRDSYIKGAWILHMLRLQLGDDVFFPMIQAWAQYKSPATTNNFFQFVEQFSGQDLTVFRHQWLQISGIPRYILAWHYEDQLLSIRICNQRDATYDVTLSLHVIGTDNTILETKQFDLQDNAIINIPLETMPHQIEVDPDQMVLGAFNTQQVTNISSCLFLTE